MRFLDGLHEFLESDLPRRVVEALRRKPQTMFAGPMVAIGIDAPMAQEKTQNLLAGAPQGLHRRLTSATEITHGFMGVVGNPNRRQLPRAEQRGLGHGVAAIGLDVIAGPRRDQRRRDHHAFVPEHGDLPVKAVATRTGFVAERQLVVFGGEAIDHFGHRLRPARNFADKAYLATPTPFGDRHRDSVLVRIHRDVCHRRLFHGSFPMHEALANSSTNPRCCMPWNEPPATDIASRKTI